MILFLKQKNNISKQAGFTLIELMVATTIFVSVMLMALGSLIVSMDGAKKAQALRVSMDNVNFAMDTMSRNIRTGTNYYCASLGEGVDITNVNLASKDCASGGAGLAFKPADGSANRVIYIRIVDSNNKGRLRRCSITNLNCSDIVASNVNVDSLNFYVTGAEATDVNMQPKVYITMKGSVTIKGVATPFALQTLASQRVVQ